MRKWQCRCGYVYDPAKGDPKQGVKPGTAFEDLPDDWRCPTCGVRKEAFSPVRWPDREAAREPAHEPAGETPAMRPEPISGHGKSPGRA